MKRRHEKMPNEIFRRPTHATLEWKRIESLFLAVGAEVIEGDGSRMRFFLNDTVGTFHRPHPRKEAKPYHVRDARAFLVGPGVKP